MKLSVIIVNYNVRYFLEQCLYSVRKAAEGIESEVFVVDNNSVDGSVKMLEDKFPEVRLIANKANHGFSRANNQAIQEASGEYVLLLNPDTVVEDDTFSKVVQFMDEHPDAGGLGVKMIDGKGKFLPESKRGLPTPDVAFYKIFGLSRFFPRSRIFGKYHLGYLDMDKVHEVDVLSGAFMLIRKSVIDEIGMLDETFFMYGEDIDMSYRITQAGYRNYYFPGTRIIHYKGESTKKGSINYVLVFYNAMIIFARKHFSLKNARIFSLLINLAVYLRASLAILSRFIKKALLPILDTVLIYLGAYFIQNYWEEHVIFEGGGQYPMGFTFIILPVYTMVWIISNYLSGVYDKPVKIAKIFQGIAMGTLFILVIYALLPESLRFSRAIILLGSTWGLVSMIGIRFLLTSAGFKDASLRAEKNKRFIIIGDDSEARRVSELLHRSYQNPGFIGLVSSTADGNQNDDFIGNVDQVKEIILIYRINEVIFCSKSLSHQSIMDQMAALQDTRVDYKIAPEESISIIGSNSINTAGDLYTIYIHAISHPTNRRNKRFIDILSSLAFLPASPILLFLVRRPSGLIPNILKVMAGRRSWVGYIEQGKLVNEHLPTIKKGVLNPLDAFNHMTISDEMQQRLNLIYARDYSIKGDLNIVVKGLRDLGRKS